MDTRNLDPPPWFTAAVRECCAPLKTCDAGSAMDCVIFRFLVA